ncbi:hypothetical protein X735_09860 [Mesorhizobium sp. L2C085B000]|uniref:hypothetical protein n=1 Tax=Mesorhizobium sp. L2C085B000 TaxID=1287117 RepID=UPI0003CFA7CC|nr:hypothetical protein [Mesorhizobium sp. L2C085B000]ESZ17693.1 hypothetical protein X735_09860 [Mesorhizobium sp. L2C085B000]
MPVILDQFGQPVRISPLKLGYDDDEPISAFSRSRVNLDATIKAELEAEAAEREAAAADRAAEREDIRQAERAEIHRARAAGRASGVAEGKKIGRKAFYQRMNDVVRGAHGNGALAQAALELALDAPDLTAAVALSIAGRGVRGSASLANRDSLPDSLATALSQLAGA